MYTSRVKMSELEVTSVRNLKKSLMGGTESGSPTHVAGGTKAKASFFGRVFGKA